MTKKQERQFNKEFYALYNAHNARIEDHSAMPCGELFALIDAYHIELESLYVKYGVVE